MQVSPIETILAELRIRAAVQADLRALEWEGEYAHFRNLFADTYQLVAHNLARIWIAETAHNYLIGQVFVSLKGGRPELADGKDRAYIYGFRVRPAYRNQGVGTRMMFTVEEDLRQNGYQIATLNVAQTNRDARRFYERLQYRVVGSDPGNWSYFDQFGNKHEVHEPAWRMEKELP